LLLRQSRVDDQLANFTNLISLQTGGGCVYSSSPWDKIQAPPCMLYYASSKLPS
jgi:hypothetical protein